MAVRALVFDVFGTLVDWRSGIAAAFRAAGAPGDPEELADGWRARYAPILGRGDRRLAPVGAARRAAPRDARRPAGRARHRAPGRDPPRLVRAWHHLDPWPDVRAGLEALRRERVVATLSNAHVAMLVDLARHGDLRFDTLLSAELAGTYKPAPETYRMAARLLGLEPARGHARRGAPARPRGRAPRRPAQRVHRPPARVRAWLPAARGPRRRRLGLRPARARRGYVSSAQRRSMSSRPLRDQLLGLAAQRREVLRARVVEVVGRLVEARLQADVAVVDQPLELGVDRVRAAVEDDVDDRPRPFELAPVLDLARTAAGACAGRCRARRAPRRSPPASA